MAALEGGTGAGDLPVARSVVLVDASAAQRRLARAALEHLPGLVVVGEARTAAQAVGLVLRLRPSAVLLDLGPPGEALAAVEQLMATCPTPVLVTAPACGTRATEAAAVLAAGAVDVLARPDLDDAGDRAAYAVALCAGLQVAVRVRAIRHPRGRLREAAAGRTAPSQGSVRLLAVGASTGGPQALRTVLAALPADLAQAVVVVQHMAVGFLPGLAEWLDALVPLPVRVGAAGERLQPGTVTLAPGPGNLVVQDDRLRTASVDAPAGQFHAPGVDATFASVAQVLGPYAVGVLLTGMGRDGARGLAAMRACGATTYAQDEASSAVYGMPAAAVAAGGVVHQLPVHEIGPAVLAELGRQA